MNPLPRIHILGIGNLGRLFAHALANQPNPPPITLLLHRSSLLSDWDKAGRKIEITTDGIPSSTGAFDVEVIDDDSNSSNTSHQTTQTPFISNVIVTTKTLYTTKAIASIKHRLSSKSTILFCQNGMGTTEEVTSSVFPEISTRPQYLAAVTSHGVYSTAPFRSVHAGKANVTISYVNGGQGSSNSNLNPNSNLTSTPSPPSIQTAEYLLTQIANAPILSATEVLPLELRNLQLDKLAVNAILNPLTAIFRCKNGELFGDAVILRLARRLLGEVSQVLLSLPEASTGPAISGAPAFTPAPPDASSQSRFSASALEDKLLSVAAKTAGNTSSMLQDVLAGRPTEIDYINGWIIKKGRECGVECRVNEVLVKMVKEGRVVRREEIGGYFTVRLMGGDLGFCLDGKGRNV